MNYNTLPAIYRKGTCMIWENFDEQVVSVIYIVTNA